MAQILVIDDDETERLLVKHFLEEGGHEVSLANDGIEGLGMVKDHSYDLVITDIVMPNADGLEVIFSLKETNPTLKVVAVSGVEHDNAGVPTYLGSAVAAGATTGLSKPLYKDSLLETIDEVLGRAA